MGTLGAMSFLENGAFSLPKSIFDVVDYDALPSILWRSGGVTFVLACLAGCIFFSDSDGAALSQKKIEIFGKTTVYASVRMFFYIFSRLLNPLITFLARPV